MPRVGVEMKIYRRTNSHLLCGHWNGSPIEIGLTSVMRAVPDSERYHYHNYHEYYIIIRGKGTVNVEGCDAPLEANTVLMIQPGERHRIAWIDPDEGIQWIIIKERSVPNSKIVVPQHSGA